MIEVLVTLIIILLGVLGMAGMQLLAINNTQVARTQSLAAILASSLTASLQVNNPYWRASANTTSVVNTTLGTAALNSLTANCNTSTCSPTEMAAYDLKTWGSNVSTLLPSGQGQVTCTGASPNICSISVTWNEKNVALHNQTSGATGDLATSTIATQTYRTVVNIN
jgi:type IV pilus assembly protein PilV